MSTDDYLTVEEVAEEFRTTPATIHRWRYVGTGPPAARIGRRVLYRRADVDAWASSHFEHVAGTK